MSLRIISPGQGPEHENQLSSLLSYILSERDLDGVLRQTCWMSQPAQPIWPGTSLRLGATWDGEGTNFALFAEHAEAVELCLFDDDGTERRLTLPEVTAHVWHGYVPEVAPGQRYGYRVHGPYDPLRGHRFNPAKLLLDPYAKAIEGKVDWDEAVFGYRVGAEGEDLLPDDRDSAAHVPRSVVVHDGFPWGDDRRPDVPWEDTIIYEAHVRGFTMRHPDVPEHQRGTYAAMGSPPVIDYLTRLGVTTLELQPVHHFVSEHALIRRGLTNYWGYNSIGYFAPEASYAMAGQAGEQVREFKAMVRNLHAAGIEVILDVVYNHTAEGDHLGPTLSFRGLDNQGYYRLDPESPRYYVDYTGCGNTLNVPHPQVLKLIMDSLRYWVEEMHVDGFRFDLASALARSFHEVDRLSAFFDLIHQDPVISRVKLIAEPWDVGEGGYQVGKFPVLWTEWNGRYRDTIRDFWRGARTGVADLAYRLTGSSDLYQSDGRRPYASINFVTAHDGFTLNDLVSYERKHNEANGEGNRDGSDDNRSWNCGVEGPSDNPLVVELRERQKRNFLATLLMSAGVPMLLAGDELSRTQRGNNNAYCQDNEISWIDWDLDERRQRLLAFTRALIALRRGNPVLRRRRFFQGQAIHGSSVKDIGWFTPDGNEMDDERWREPDIATLGVFFNGEEIPDRGPRGERITGDSFLLLLNGGDRAVSFNLPGQPWAKEYELLVDTGIDFVHPAGLGDAPAYQAGEELPMAARSLAILRRRR
jgi:glycogen operon protein